MRRGRLTSRAADVGLPATGSAAYDGPPTASARCQPTALADADRLDRERRAGRVRGPLHGVPVLLKDNIGTTDLPTTAGSIALEGNVPTREAFLTPQLRAAGAVVLGKTNLSEFANWVDLSMPNGYSSLGGQVRNAYDLGDPSRLLGRVGRRRVDGLRRRRRSAPRPPGRSCRRATSTAWSA